MDNKNQNIYTMERSTIILILTLMLIKSILNYTMISLCKRYQGYQLIFNKVI
jgi:hypothetical protein